MTKILDFLKTTIVGGLLFLLPIAATALIFFKAGKMAAEVAAPLADKLPLPKAEAVILLYLLAATLFILLDSRTKCNAVKLAHKYFDRRFVSEAFTWSSIEEHFDLCKLCIGHG
jgi:uncharacterized membrane protein